MHEIVVLSGKGGAGKTSVTAALARAMSAREKIVVCDYDVDAPDLHILLKPETEMRADFVSGHLAVFNSDNCIDCTQCLAFCRFDAIKQAAPYEYPVIEQLCEGCAVCVKLCPELAFDFVPRHCGEYYRSRTRFGTMIHAELTPGAENSGRLILLLKQEAAKAAQADGFVAALPQKLDAHVAQGGGNFSGGQRQRLAIARALVRKADLYLFDDSFSALDVKTDAALRAALASYEPDAAKLIIAQRVSTILTADQILVLDEGRLVGKGTHEELLISCPTYRDIVRSQMEQKGA